MKSPATLFENTVQGTKVLSLKLDSSYSKVNFTIIRTNYTVFHMIGTLFLGRSSAKGKFGKLSSGHRTGKGQFSFQSQRKAMPKNAQTTQLHSSHPLVK